MGDDLVHGLEGPSGGAWLPVNAQSQLHLSWLDPAAGCFGVRVTPQNADALI